MKILVFASIVLISFWLGKMSAEGKRKNIESRNSAPERPVIDIDAEDK